MKKFLLSGLLSFIISASFAGIVEQEYYFDNPTIKQSGDYQLIGFDGLMLTGITGEPTLPYQAVKLLLPPGEMAVSMEIIRENEVNLQGVYEVYPMQSSRPLSDESPFIFQKKIQLYNQNITYPSDPKGQLTTSYLNGHSIAMSSFTPLLYEPLTGQVSYYSKVKVIITTVPDPHAEEVIENLSSSESASKRIANFIQNPALLKQYPSLEKSGDEYEFLIITPQQFQSNFDGLVTAYVHMGMKTEIVTKEEINSNGTGQDLAEKIRNYIIQEYQDNGIEYVLLGGDVEHIPYRGFYCYVQSGSGYEDDDIPADMYYSALDGTWNDDNDNLWGEIGEDDLLPEIAVGRFSFSNLSELNNMLNKTIMYQTNPVLGELTNALLAGEWLYSNPLTYGSDYLELLIGYQNENGYETWGIPEDYNYQKLYESVGSWGANDLITAINSGKQFVHHVGHANSNYVAYMYNSDITNSNFYGANGVDHNFTLFLSHGCICGAFDDNDCIMEKMHSIENFAVAVIGNSRYGWFNEGQTEGPGAHLNREMVDALYHEKMNHLGAAFTECKIQTAPWVTAPGQWEEGALRWNFYDINILGDPGLSVWSDEPMDIDVSHSGVYLMGTNSYEVNVSSDGLPSQNLTCTFAIGDDIYGVATTDATGIANINVEDMLNPCSAQVIVSGYNVKPEAFDVECTINTNVLYRSAQSKVNIYPNPVKDNFVVEYYLPKSSEISVEVVDQLGSKKLVLLDRQVQAHGLYKLNFSKPDLENGIYILNIQSENFSASKKLILTQ
ncbi:MAG: T9SS type A sorting domain-containing protein [Bacteroidales bacterium]|nr:T9SS type A sorting domain-containing protein [Bacteroidales bacterium]